MVWVELTPFDNIIPEHKERNAKIIVYRKFAEKLAVTPNGFVYDNFTNAIRGHLRA